MNFFALLKTSDEPAAASALTVEDVYLAHADFVWKALQRFGVRTADLDDVLQEVFVVVHKKLPSFRGDAQMTTWLYGICLRVASVHRRRSHVRREKDLEELEERHSVDRRNP